MAIINDKSRRWFIAIVMAFMIVGMALPSWFGSNSRNRIHTNMGTIYDNQPLSVEEVELAKGEWELLSRPAINTMIGNLPIAIHLFTGELSQYGSAMDFYQAVAVAAQGVKDLGDHPEVFALLKREAQRANVTINPQKVDDILNEELRIPPTTDPRLLSNLRQAISSMVLVETYANQAALSAKVTRPELRSHLAQSLQSLRVGVAVIDAADFRAGVQTPALDTLKVLYDKFKDRPANDPRFDTNPFGFGYLQSDRVKLQYISLPRREVLRVARESKTAYDWEVDAQRYYIQNQSLYMAEPTTKPSDSFSLSSSPSTQKVLKPFPEVQASILETLHNQRADQISQQVLRRMTSLLSADYRAHADAIARKAQSPATSVGQPIDSFDYLRAVAAKIEQETKVLPSITSFSDRYLDESALGNLEGIGRATLQVTNSSHQATPFARLIMSRARPFYEKTQSKNREPGLFPLDILEPTPVLEDNASNIYVARLTEAAVARVPTFDEVVLAVTTDAMTQASQDRAKAAANDMGNQDRDKSLMELALQAGRKFYTIPALRDASSIPPEMGLSRISQTVLLQEAFNLLRADPSVNRPRVVASLPRDRKVAVLELLDVTPLAPTEDRSIMEIYALHQLRLQHQRNFLAHFYEPDSVISRTNYQPHPDFARKNSETPTSTTPSSQPSSN